MDTKTSFIPTSLLLSSLVQLPIAVIKAVEDQSPRGVSPSLRCLHVPRIEEESIAAQIPCVVIHCLSVQDTSYLPSFLMPILHI